MAKRKHIQEPIIVPEPQVGKRYGRVMDMSPQGYARLQKEARNPSIRYWIFAISIAIAMLASGIYKIRAQGIAVEGIAYLTAGIVLSILIVARLIRDRKERA